MTSAAKRLGRAVRWTPEQAAAYQARRGKAPVFTVVGDSPSKYHSAAIVIDGMRFDSKLEGKRYCQLVILRQAGDVIWFTRQVPFYLPGGVRYVVDFLVVWKDGSNTIEDCKGFETPASLAKRRICEGFHRIHVRVLKRGDF